MTTETSAPSTIVCPTCGTPTNSGEKFCGACGTLVATRSAATTAETLAATAPVATLATPRAAAVDGSRFIGSQDKTRRRRLQILVATAVAIALAAGLLVANDVGAHGQLSATRRHLAATAATLKSTKGQLTLTHGRLASTRGELTRTKSRLGSANADRAQLTTQLASTQQELAGVRGNLSDTQNQLNLQAGQLEIVKTCLSGFATALDADLNGDYSSGLAALQSVESACREASKLFN
jgi:hypothetical protein